MMKQLVLVAILALVCTTTRAEDHEKLAKDCMAELKKCNELLAKIDAVEKQLCKLKDRVDQNETAIKTINDQLRDLKGVKQTVKTTKRELELTNGQKDLTDSQQSLSQTRNSNQQEISLMRALTAELNRRGDTNTRIAMPWRAYTPGVGVSRIANFRNRSSSFGSQNLGFSNQGLDFSNQNLGIGFGSQALPNFAPRINAERAVLPPLTNQRLQFSNQSANFNSAPQMMTQQVTNAPQQVRMFMTPQYRGTAGFNMYQAPMVSPGSYMTNVGQGQAMQSYSIRSAPVTQSYSIQSAPVYGSQSYSIQSAPVFDSGSVRYWRVP